MRDLALVLRSLWFRRGTSAAVLVVAALVIGGAATGPLFLRAAAESVLHDTLHQAGLPAGRLVSDQLVEPLGKQPLAVVRRVTARRLGALPTLERLLGRPVPGLEVATQAGPRGATSNPVHLAWRRGACQHVDVVRGHCPQRPGQVMISFASTAIPGWRVGSSLIVAGRPMTVSGSYRPVRPLGDYWAGRPYFVPLSGDATGAPIDDLFTPRATIGGLPAATGTTATLDRGLRLDRVRLADVPALTRELRKYGGGVVLHRQLTETSQTGIPSVLQQGLEVAATLTAPVVVVEAQLLVLCWLVLFLVVANGAEARGPEVALAKLRGVPTVSTVAFGLLDSLLLVAVALPLGLAAAYGWMSGMAGLQLAPGTPVAMTGSAVEAALGAAAGACVAAVLAAVRTLRRPVVEQWRRATRRARGRPWLVDAVVVLAAIGGLVALVRTSALGSATAPSTWALLAPGLVVLAAALVGSRVLPWLCRALFAPSRRRGWLGTFLAVRQIARRPSTLRLALVLAVGVGLVTFAVDAWAVGRSNAHDRAWTEVGAAETLEVLAPPGQDIGTIVDRLDPSGRLAAAVSEATDFSDVPPVWMLAVQPHRFAHVAFWRPDFGPALPALAAGLDPRVAPLVRLDGDALAVHVRVLDLAARRSPVLVADLGQPGGGLAPVELGPLREGRQVLRAPLPCRRCLLDGVHLDRPGAAFYPIHARILLTAVAVHRHTGWQPVPADLGRDEWRAASAGAAPPRPTAGGLVLSAHADAVGTPTWRVADVPRRIPALVTGTATAAGSRHRIAGLDGDDLPIAPVSSGPALPGVGAAEVIVNRDFAQRAMRGESGATDMVWLAPSAVATFPARLQKAGVTIVSRQSAAHQTALYQRQGPELALLLFLCGAALGAALAAGGCVLTSYLAGRRRTYEIAALLAQGLGSRTIFVALAAEQGLFLAFGIAVGAAAGIAGARIALPDIPEFADNPTAPPMLYDLHATVIAGTLAATVVALALVVVVSSVGLLRTSRFTQLREAPA